MELIEAYFNEELSPEKKNEFERRITADPAFAEEMAFYLSSRQAAAAELEEDRSRLKGIYEQYKRRNVAEIRKQAPVRKLWPWAAAAAVLAGIIFGWYALFQPVSLPGVGRQVYKGEISKSRCNYGCQGRQFADWFTIVQ